MAREKDWGPIPTPQDVADQMNSIDKLRDDLASTAIEMEQVRKEHIHRQRLLDTAKAELGRMLKARSPLDLSGTDFRVIHIDEAHRDVLSHQFNIHRVEG